ncbi:MAG: NADH-quinone oxidoreductase subunit NuoN, partial [Pseudomonadota bacterium]
DRIYHFLGIIFLVALLAIMILSPLSIKQILFSKMFIADNFSQTIKMILIIATALTLIISDAWLIKGNNQKFEYVVLVLFSLLGMLLMVSANDMLSLYVSLELASLPLYVLASFSRDSLKSTEAGVKYFVLGAIASGMILFGISLIYGFAGTTNFTALRHLFDGSFVASKGILLGLVLIITGLSFKISAAPFHMWTPDVYEGAPTPVTAFFSVAPKIAALALFIRVIIEPFGSLIHSWQPVLILISILSMLIGAFGALTQTNIKRLLAYSSIGHIGYALMGIATGTVEGISAVVMYFALYTFITIGAFACILLIERDGEYLEKIEDFSGLARTNPAVAFCLAGFMLSMAGIPPLAGFFGKMYFFSAALHSGLFALAVIGVLSSVVACFYYLKIIKVMYFDEPPENKIDANFSISTLATIYLCATLNLLFFINPTPLITIAKTAAEALFK